MREDWWGRAERGHAARSHREAYTDLVSSQGWRPVSGTLALTRYRSIACSVAFLDEWTSYVDGKVYGCQGRRPHQERISATSMTRRSHWTSVVWDTEIEAQACLTRL